MAHWRITRGRGKDPAQSERLRRTHEGGGGSGHSTEPVPKGTLSSGSCLAPLFRGGGGSSISLWSLPEPHRLSPASGPWHLPLTGPGKLFPQISLRSLPLLFQVLVPQGTPLQKLTPSHFKYLELPSPLYPPISPHNSPIPFINGGSPLASVPSFLFPLRGL